MKKFIFLMVVVMLFLISCSSNKKISNDADFSMLSASENYFNSPNAISESEAKAMIAGFPKHKYRGWRHKKLINGWSRFDTADIRKIITDPNVDSIKFFSAVVLKNNNRDSSLVPTLVIQVVFKPGTMGKGDALQQPSAYFKTIKICPPPAAGCRVSGD